jgi:hypothetical protein
MPRPSPRCGNLVPMGRSRAPFPIGAWRHAVDLLAVRLGTDAIAPFGFELTGSIEYLFSHLRYLFIYVSRSIGLPPPQELILVARGALGDSIPDTAETIEIVDFDRLIHRTGATGSRTLIIRSVENRRPLLEEWVRYIVATAFAANRAKITAVVDFDSDLMAQRYCCQLAMMHDALFATLPGAPRVTVGTEVGLLLRTLQRISLEDRYNHELIEHSFAQQISVELSRYYSGLNAYLDATDGATPTDPVADFHGRQPLLFRSNPTVAAVTATAMQRYRSYGAG